MAQNFCDLLSRSEQERLKHRARQAEDQVTSLRRQLDDRSREVEQLTTLSLKGDATLTEYMAQLTVRPTKYLKALDMYTGVHGTRRSKMIVWQSQLYKSHKEIGEAAMCNEQNAMPSFSYIGISLETRDPNWSYMS